MAEISFYNEEIDFPPFFSESLILKWLNAIAAAYRIKFGMLSFIFCNDEYILDINRQYLNHDYYTDVITFDYSEKGKLSGDVFISIDTVLSNSEQYGTTYEEEFHRVLCHSILHLAGFKDKSPSDEVEMRQNEDNCLNMLKMIK